MFKNNLNKIVFVFALGTMQISFATQHGSKIISSQTNAAVCWGTIVEPIKGELAPNLYGTHPDSARIMAKAMEEAGQSCIYRTAAYNTAKAEYGNNSIIVSEMSEDKGRPILAIYRVKGMGALVYMDTETALHEKCVKYIVCADTKTGSWEMGGGAITEDSFKARTALMKRVFISSLTSSK